MTAGKTSPTVALLGGDARQISAAITLAGLGYHVCVWGVGEESDYPAIVQFCSQWKEAVDTADALLLPLPVSKDEIHLYAPLAQEGAALRLDVLFDRAEGKLALGGRFSDTQLRRAAMQNIRCIDYFNSEILQLKNALPTAEGALAVAMRELPVTVDGVHSAVIGYGRIGALLSQKLLSLGAHVTVYARRQESLTLAELHQCSTVLLGAGKEEAVLSHLGRDVRVIFNTVPVRLFSEAVISSLPAGCVFIDLASAPGGIDHGMAERMGIRCIWATSLPGKYAPETAGRMIAESVSLFLRGEDFSVP